MSEGLIVGLYGQVAIDFQFENDSYLPLSFKGLRPERHTSFANCPDVEAVDVLRPTLASEYFGGPSAVALPMLLRHHLHCAHGSCTHKPHQTSSTCGERCLEDRFRLIAEIPFDGIVASKLTSELTVLLPKYGTPTY